MNKMIKFLMEKKTDPAHFSPNCTDPAHFVLLGKTSDMYSWSANQRARTIAKQQTLIDERVLSFSSDNSELIDSQVE